MFPAPAVRELTRWGLTLGLGVAEILWTLTEKRWTPRLKVWHPQFVYFDWATFRYMVLCVEGVIPLPNTDEQIHSDGKWFVWAPNGYRYGWLRGLVRRLGHKYVMRGWTYRDWARYNERHGMAILGAVVPSGGDKQVKDRFLASLANIGSDAAVALPAGETKDEPGFDLKVIEATARTYQTFQLFKQQLDADISIAVLGQNQAGDPAVGSQARAQVQDQVRIDKRVTDAKIDEAFRDQVLWWDALYNSGDPELAPIPVHQVEPPQDELDEANALKALGDAAAALDAADPGRVDIPALLRPGGRARSDRTPRSKPSAPRAPSGKLRWRRRRPPTTRRSRPAAARAQGPAARRSRDRSPPDCAPRRDRIRTWSTATSSRA
jgi:phage gp29-like protein